jgi:class 3 adenylate cyclase
MLADCAMTLSVASTVPAATAYSPLDMKIYFLRPARPDGRELAARARVTHRGRTIAVVTCEIVDADDRVVAQASGSVLILPGRPWERPVSVADEFRQDIDRVLATVLFVDLVDSTGRAARLGDRAWKQLLEDHHAAAREELQRYRGNEIDNAGDGFLVSFDGAARAIRCAAAIRERARALGLEVRAGVHTGECELSGRKLVGLTVHAGARIAAEAAPGEVMTSSVVRDLASGAGILFEERGVRSLKGVPGEWPLYAASVH